MITIVNPMEHIDKLWGKQRIMDDDTYRMMRYVLRVDYDGKVLLHNVVTGQLVILEQAEAEAVDKLPMKYGPVMEQLVTKHYLVAEAYDEHLQVVKMREILRKLDDAHKEQGIIYYTILPTTACNAHCFYCYERGLKTETMTPQIIRAVVEFIKKQYKGDRIWIRWFGGEPTLAEHLIDQICKGLEEKQIDFASRMTTNGFLIDGKMIMKMKELWHLEQVVISMDGSEENYNRIKAFADVNDNPYQRVMRNIGFLLNDGISVALRMNFDKENYCDFRNLLDDVEKKFGHNPLLEVRPHQINPRTRDTDVGSYQEYEQWYNEKIVELNEMSRRKGFFHKEYPLPSLKYKVCMAASDNAVVIMPDGSLVSCPDLLSSDQIKGDLWQGIIDIEKTRQWKQFGDYERCRKCLFFPRCAVVINCEAGGICTMLNEYSQQYSNSVKELLQAVL